LGFLLAIIFTNTPVEGKYHDEIWRVEKQQNSAVYEIIWKKPAGGVRRDDAVPQIKMSAAFALQLKTIQEDQTYIVINAAEGLTYARTANTLQSLGFESSTVSTICFSQASVTDRTRRQLFCPSAAGGRSIASNGGEPASAASAHGVMPAEIFEDSNNPDTAIMASPVTKTLNRLPLERIIQTNAGVVNNKRVDLSILHFPCFGFQDYSSNGLLTSWTRFSDWQPFLKGKERQGNQLGI